MAGVKWSQFTLTSTIDLTDNLVFLDDPTGTPDNKRITVANFLFVIGLMKGEDGYEAGVTTSGVTVTFGSTHSSYEIAAIRCRNATDNTEVGYTISNRTATGFKITPIATSNITWVILDQ